MSGRLWNVELKISGSAFLTVEADDAEQAAAKAEHECTIDDFEGWLPDAVFVRADDGEEDDAA